MNITDKDNFDKGVKDNFDNVHALTELSRHLSLQLRQKSRLRGVINKHFRENSRNLPAFP